MTKARLIAEDRVVTVLCPMRPRSLVRDAERTWWEPSANLSATGVVSPRVKPGGRGGEARRDTEAPA